MGFSAGIVGVILFPLVARAFGLIASIVGIMMVKLTRKRRDPMKALNRGYYITVVLAMAAFGGATYWLLNTPAAPECLVALLPLRRHRHADLIAFVYITQYYTEYKYRPVQSIAEASKTGPATNIITGIAVGLECTWLPALVIGAAPARLLLPGRDELAGRGVNARPVRHRGRHHGHAATAAYILAMDTFGPITDNAGGIVEMSRPARGDPREDRPAGRGRQHHQGPDQGIRDRLRRPGRLPAVRGLPRRGRPVRRHEPRDSRSRSNLAKPAVFVGGLLGAMLVFLFSSLAIRAVGKAAQAIIEEVRRQYPSPAENGIIKSRTDFKPDYGTCVDIVTKGALQPMIAAGPAGRADPDRRGPALQVSSSPQADRLIGAEAVAALLMVGTIAGILMALFLNNGGGAWDNAKKYIETGATAAST